MPRPRSLTETEIAAAALAVIDRDGLDALSMRAVAKQLGTGTMSLYRYVEDRAQLETLVVDLVLGSVDYTLPPRAPGAGRCRSCSAGPATRWPPTPRRCR
ncbi:TetR/AcrR family transcriptional regulator [Thermocatellispora tengchongensis]|uniref:TetR/AcrR family transcriptional regulator n=1 Tax=Thermocatellispora tengchongensis TaxID=1073253 RepID=UPI00363381C3